MSGECTAVFIFLTRYGNPMPMHNPPCSWLAQAAQQRAGVRFLKHDIRTEHDDASDVARLYRIRATPTFAFLVGGAKVGSRV